jgi:hypothetical protein
LKIGKKLINIKSKTFKLSEINSELTFLTNPDDHTCQKKTVEVQGKFKKCCVTSILHNLVEQQVLNQTLSEDKGKRFWLLVK